MNCRDCVYGYYLDEQGVVVCMADESFLAPCENMMKMKWMNFGKKIWIFERRKKYENC